MADHKPINWAFPFKLKGADGEASKDITNPELYYAALAQAKDGFYPMGASGNWHGGVHFDEATGAVLDQSEVRCIADGEVIAYRIDESYPTTTYGEVPAVVHLPFSTGFVLVKHRLELPPKPVETSADGTTAALAPAPALTFYSLYMHLLDWTSYQAQPTLPRPDFWCAGLCKVKPDAPDKVRGLNVREHHKPKISDVDYEANNAKYENKLTTLPRGTRIETGEAAASPNHNWRRLIRATPAVEGLAENTGWVYVLEAKELAENHYLVSEDKSKDIPAIEQIGLHVRESANGSSDVLAVLPRGTEIQVSGEGNYVKLEAIVSGDAIPPLTAGADGKLPGYVWLESLEAQRSPHDLAKNKVYPLPAAQQIKAGELIGHIGQYQNFDDDRPRPILHLEVFSCEDVPAFITQSKAWAGSLPAEQKTLIKIHKDSVIRQPTTADTQIAADCDVRAASDSPTEGCWAKVQPYVVLKVNKSDLGTYGSKQYPLNASQKSTIASAHGIDVSEMPDQVDFLMETYLADGTDPQPYVSGNIPTTRPMRKIGAKLNTPVWVNRSALNAQGQRASTSGALEAWNSFPLSQATDGPACGFERILSKASWNDLSTDHKAIDANTEKTHWWYLTVANTAGQEISGWVLEAPLIVTQHSPWEWPGFSQIEDITPVVSQQAQNLSAEGALSTEEIHTYAAKIDEAERGTMFQRLFDIIDQPNAEGVRDKKLTPAEIKSALGKPWLAQQISLLITRYESEWFWQEVKWDELDKLMDHTPANQNLNWVREKKRIQKLSWWSEIAGAHGISADGLVWHFHSTGLVTCFTKKSSDLITLKMLKKAKSSVADEYYISILPYLNKYAHIYKIDTPLLLAHFLSQVGHESGFKVRSEDLNYSARRMREVFGCRGNINGYDEVTDECIALPRLRPKLWSEESTYAHNAENLGNYVYASRNGNGDESSGDGYKYRGRGIIQLTGKANYENYNRIHNEKNPSDPQNFIENPDLIIDNLDYGIESAFVWWDMNRLNRRIQDSYVLRTETNISDHVADISTIVNGGTIGLTERVELFNTLQAIIREEHGI